MVRAFLAGGQLPAELYRDLMDAGFRRSGRLVYQPVCASCRQCIPLRVLVGQFSASKSQRRCRRRNADVNVTVAQPLLTEEKWHLYRRYISQWHDRPAPGTAACDAGKAADSTATGAAISTTAAANASSAASSANCANEAADRESLESFLYDSPVPTLEFEYRLPPAAGGHLIAIGICDISRRALSSVYFYFDPAHAARSLGTFGALHEIDFARGAGLEHYYLGYWISGCGAMRYKSSFRPHELLTPQGHWRPANDQAGHPAGEAGEADW